MLDKFTIFDRSTKWSSVPYINNVGISKEAAFCTIHKPFVYEIDSQAGRNLIMYQWVTAIFHFNFCIP
jgi:hypothetical protein